MSMNKVNSIFNFQSPSSISFFRYFFLFLQSDLDYSQKSHNPSDFTSSSSESHDSAFNFKFFSIFQTLSLGYVMSTHAMERDLSWKQF